MGATALGCQVVLQLFYLLPVLLQLHLKLLYQATEITKHRKNVQYFHLCPFHEVMKAEICKTMETSEEGHIC